MAGRIDFGFRGVVALLLILAVTGFHAPWCRAADGDLDPSFGIQGIARAGVMSDYESEVAVDLHGATMVLLAGWDFTTWQDYVARFDATGSLDAHFGVSGIARTGLMSFPGTPVAVAVQADARIVLCGTAGGDDAQIYVARFLPTGLLDPTFGVGGIVYARPTLAESRVALVLQEDGKIVLAGFDRIVWQHVLTRFTPEGTLDESFGTGGTAYVGLPYTDPDSHVALARQVDGKLVLAGHDVDVGYHDYVARFLPSGDLDSAFALGGIARVGVTSQVYAGVGVAIQADGKIVLAGNDADAGVDFLARFTDTGSLDHGFGVGGIVRCGWESLWMSHVAVTIQGDDRAVLAGNGPGGAFLARFLSTGTADSTFGTAGIASSGLCTDLESGIDVMVQRDDKIIVGGIDHCANDDGFLARFVVGSAILDTGNASERSHGPISLRSTPNPFSAITVMGYELPTPGVVSVEVFDVSGRVVRSLLTRQMQLAGHHEATWDGRDSAGRLAPAGLYYWQVWTDSWRRTGRAILLR